VGRGEQRDVRLENWAAMAAGWERAREEREKVAAPVTEWLVRELAPKPGDTVLELKAGQGDRPCAPLAAFVDAYEGSRQ
jgi:hypothetical protein